MKNILKLSWKYYKVIAIIVGTFFILLIIGNIIVSIYMYYD
jgi:hypothetical protein